jgi:sphingomyelin phosphodiesterase
VFYANNGTRMAADTAVATSWITPSLTPLSNLNSGFRAYDVDPVTFNILDAYTWISNISAAHALDGQSAHGAVYSFEYSAREAYGADIAWPAAAPLNATWWHMVTEQWQAQPALVELFTQFQGKNSVLTTNCTSAACVESKICYARSGSYPLAGLCPYGSKCVPCSSPPEATTDARGEQVRQRAVGGCDKENLNESSRCCDVIQSDANMYVSEDKTTRARRVPRR